MYQICVPDDEGLVTSLQKMPTLTVDDDVQVPTRDGTKLATTVFRPAGAGPYPSVLMRTPYDRTSASSTTLQVHAPALAAAGYAVVLQDVRGRFGSEGTFEPFVAEQEDGIDSLDWLAGQTWCNGRIGMAGVSYNAFTQIAVVAAGAEHLQAWVPGLTPADIRTTWIRQGGVFDLGFHLAWGLGSIVGQDRRTQDPRAISAAFNDPGRTVRRGSTDQPELITHPAGSWYGAWLGSADPYPDDMRVPTLSALETVHTPGLVIGGWFDVFCQGSIELGSALRRVDPDAHALVVGPWDHAGLPLRRRSGDRDFGATAVVDLHQSQKAWFDRHLREVDSPTPCVEVFVTGANRWIDAAALPTATPRQLTLTSRMTIEERGEGGEHRVRLDAADPTPTLGGRVFPWEPVLRCGSFEQSRRRHRSDVLAFSGRPLDRPMLVVGPVKCRIQLGSDVDRPTVALTLLQINAEDTAFNIADGLGMSSAPAGDEDEIVVGDIAHEFAAGSKIGLDVAFGSFPRLAPSTGTRTVGRAVLTVPEVRP